MNRKRIGMVIFCLSLAGCAGPDPLKEDFGESVRHMIRVQTNSPGYEGAGLDGERAERTLREYRRIEASGTASAGGDAGLGEM